MRGKRTRNRRRVRKTRVRNTLPKTKRASRAKISRVKAKSSSSAVKVTPPVYVDILKSRFTSSTNSSVPSLSNSNMMRTSSSDTFSGKTDSHLQAVLPLKSSSKTAKRNSPMVASVEGKTGIITKQQSSKLKRKSNAKQHHVAMNFSASLSTMEEQAKLDEEECQNWLDAISQSESTLMGAFTGQMQKEESLSMAFNSQLVATIGETYDSVLETLSQLVNKVKVDATGEIMPDQALTPTKATSEGASEEHKEDDNSH